MAGLPVAITGLGCVGAPGVGIAAQVQALRDCRDGLQRQSDGTLPLAGLLPVGAVTADLGARRHLGRTAALGGLAGAEALGGLSAELRQNTGLCVGSSTAGMRESEAAWFADAQAVQRIYAAQPLGSVAARLQRHLHLGGPRAAHSVACVSAACAIAQAMEWIRRRRCPRVLVVGCDALTRVTMAGFHALQVTDPAGCRPGDQERGGMSLGEAGAALLLEDLATARQRGATVLAVLTGWGIAADAHHATAPHPEGRGLAAAITQAMDDASLSPRDIDLVIAHATGTRDNDAVECAVLAKHFGAVPTSAIKRSYGHTMGAAAAVELVAAVLAIQHRQHWGSAGCRLPLAGPRILTRTETAPTRCVLSTNLAFGGVNTALLCAAPGDGVPNAITQQTQPMRCLAKGQADSHDSSALPDWVPAAARRRLDANQRLAVLAVAAAIAGHTLPPATAVIVASAYGNVDASWRFAVSLAEHGDHAGSPTPFTTSVHNAVAGCLAALLQLQGPTSTLSDGDGSAEAARDLAQAWLTSGRAPAVLLVLGDRHNPWSRRVLETLAPQRNERDAYTAELWVAK